MSISQSNANEPAEPNGNNDFDPATATWDDFAEYETSIPIYSYKDKKTLEYLYHRKRLSQREIAECYDVAQTTISRWMRKRGISTGHGYGAITPHRIGNITYWRYWTRSNGIAEEIHIHQLLACLDNDPHDVFGSGTVVHHRLNSPVAINLPANLVPLDSQEHSTEHRVIRHLSKEELADRAETLLDEILDRDGTA